MAIHILYVSDNKAGHRSQAMGLYQAYQRQNPQQAIEFHEILMNDIAYVDLCLAILGKQLSNIDYQPDYIIGVGSHTHLKVYLLSKIYRRAKSIILMKTSLPLSWFDYHIIPQHDGQFHQSNVINTQGVLNPIINQHRHQHNRILIALGGSSKRHQWQDEMILTQVIDIIHQNQQSEIIITTSRRTPSDFLAKLQAYFPVIDYPQIQFFPVEQTPQGWIFEQMQLSETVWVTEDSVSMIFEALTSGANVGILQVKRLKSDRITMMLDELLNQPQPMNMSLNEADRVVRQIFNEKGVNKKCG